jgi:hypothetical protein
MTLTKKKVVSGWLKPRWPKPRVVRWLELGAIPALLGLWLPDWVGGYALGASGHPAPFPALAFPPILAYAGALVLLRACAEGVKGMGWHYRGVQVCGALAVAFAGTSVALHVLIPPAHGAWLPMVLLAVFLAMLFSTGFLWFTLAKVAEITTEKRTKVAARLILALASAATLLALGTSWMALRGGESWVLFARATQVGFAAAFVICRYGVHCYKTQKSIGATFTLTPNEQYWV